MNPQIRQLLGQQRSEDEAEREDAFLKLGMLLEKNFFLHGAEDAGTRETWQGVLEGPLLSIEMDGADRSEVIAALSEHLQAENASPSIFHALSRSASIDAEAPILRWLRDFGDAANQGAVREALFSLEELVLAAQRERRLEEARSIFVRHDGNSALKRMGARNGQLSKISLRVLKKLGLPLPPSSD